MHLASRLSIGLFLALCTTSPAQSAQVSVVSYVCNIEGVPAQLTAQVQAVSPAGIYMDSAGMFAGSIPTNEVNYYYQGTLVSQTGGRYSFQGENQFADFVDLNTNDRFRVQFTLQGQILQMIINPQGPGPVQYFCQLAGRQ
jgi:hypothetical protein